MRKVLVVITTAFVPYGGLANVMLNYYRSIDHKRFKIDFASTNRELDEKLQAELTDHGSNYYGLGDRKKQTIEYIKNLIKIIKKNNYDVIHVNANSATAAIELNIAKIYGIKNRIIHIHTSICDHPALHKILFPFFQHSYTTSIACSKKAGEWIFKDGKYIVLNNGIDTERFRYSELARISIRQNYDIAMDTVVIGHVGKIYKPKNHHFLIEVFDEYHREKKNSCLLLVGDGVMRQEIEQEIYQRGLKDAVILAGMQTNIDSYLSAMDIFCFPSIWEGMPLSIIEAQSSGLPCIVSSSIDKNVRITKDTKMLPIDQGTEIWTHALQKTKKVDRTVASDENCKEIIKAKFDAQTNARLIEKIYDDCLIFE